MKTTIASVLFFCLTAVLADWSRTTTQEFSLTNQASNITANFPNEDLLPVVGAEFRFDFTAVNYTIVSFTDLVLGLSPNYIVPYTGHSFQAQPRSSIQASFSGFFDPCRYPVVSNQTATFHYNATSDSESGQLTTTLTLREVLSLTEENQVQIQCMGTDDNACNRFYYINLSTTGEYIFNMTAIAVGSSDLITMTVAAGADNCPTSWSTSKGLHVEQQITNKKSLVISAPMSGPTRVWIQAKLPMGASTPTFKLSYSGRALLWTRSSSCNTNSSIAVSPVSQSPVAAPSNAQPDKLPTWAYVLIAIGGVIVVGLIIFGIVKLARRNKDSYTSV